MLAGAALGDIILSYDAAMPGENVLTSFMPTGTINGLDWRDNASGSRAVGQSFYVSANTIMDSFSLLANGNPQSGARGAEFTVQVFQSASETSIGSVVSTQTGTYLSDSTGVSGKWVTFDIDNITLSAGYYYTFTLSFNNSNVASQNQVFSTAASPENYAGGRNWRNDNNAGWAVANGGVADMAFVVQVIPEPVSAGLLVAGGCILMTLRRQRIAR